MSAATDSESQSSDRARSSSPVRSDEPRSPKVLQQIDAVQNDEDVDIDVTSIPSEIASDDDELDDEEDRTADEDEYFKPIKKLCMRQGVAVPVIPPKPNSSTSESNKPLSSFFIRDILNHKPAIVQRTWSPCVAAATAASAVGAAGSTEIRGIVRPWDLDSSTTSRRRPRSADDDSRSERSESDSPESPQVANPNASPLDALFEMTSKAFEGLEANEKSADSSRDHLNMFNNRQQPKKKRKSRTAFTNHQIFELEKRFLYQKYLSPADRDEIAQSLGLTNAQVITWFQNRRAKLKRDMEELKKDVETTKGPSNVHHRNIIENIQDLSLLKKNKDGKIICSMLP